jgi:Zn-dependent peptidase ImmA (M78 family)
MAMETSASKLGSVTGPGASALATEVLESHWPGGFPINPFQIAAHMGVLVYETTLDADLAGAVFTDVGGLPVIMISRDDAPVRKRFTCAHELGHLCKRQREGRAIDFLDKRNGMSSTGTDPEEVFANAFAAQLLMPDYEVVAQHKQGVGMRAMARFFGVSTAAMMNRLNHLRLTFDPSS